MKKEFTLADIFTNTPEGIVAGERAGGRAMAAEDRLPFSGINKYREQLEAIGFVFGQECGGKSTDTGHSMYIECRLPEGWRKDQDPDDPYGRTVYLFDDKNRKRASIFVKETSYDRYASISFIWRYQLTELQCDESGKDVGYSAPNRSHCQLAFTDQGEVIERYGPLYLDPLKIRERDQKLQAFQDEEALKEEAAQELERRFPDYNDPFAYWD